MVSFFKGQYFSTITDQQRVSFMYSVKNWGKSKNDKKFYNGKMSVTNKEICLVRTVFIYV